jgi:phage-related protein
VRWSRQVRDFVSAQNRVDRARLKLALRKLETRGTAAQAPLVAHMDGHVWYLRLEVGRKLFRIFYYQDGERSLHAFYAFQKSGQKLPNREKERALRLYEEHTKGVK